MKQLNILFAVGLLLLISETTVAAQQRVVVLPFRNMDRDIQYNAWSMQLADSVYKALRAHEKYGTDFILIEPDSLEMAIADLNLDPTNPQYESDMWKAVRALGAAKAVQGNFQLRGDRVLINCYVYDMTSMLPDGANQAKDLYKSTTTFLETVRPIVKRISPGLK
jgi:TolB-like protein